MKDFRKLQVWEKSHLFALHVYKATAQFPAAELYGLTSQLRRAAVSVPSNIAEGVGRGSDADMRRFLQIAFGSASEIEYQLLLAFELKFLNSEQHTLLNQDITEVKKMLSSLIRKLKADS
ncbi:MAG: four helix bundle protein [Anaerolineales bacterium]|nr:four helix bundle protein [Anaerolineales bacterium]